MRLFIYLTPCVPLSFKGEGEDIKKRGFAPLRHLLFGLVDVNEFSWLIKL